MSAKHTRNLGDGMQLDEYHGKHVKRWQVTWGDDDVWGTATCEGLDAERMAKLFYAAPDMLAALESVWEHFCTMESPHERPCSKKLLEALRKAKGIQ